MKVSNIHGGDLDIISREYGIEKSSIVNFSGNVNPLGLPGCVKNAILANPCIITNYPDVAYMELKAAIADYTGTSAQNVLTGNGSTELISTFIKTVKPQRAVIISPAYSEYLREVTLLGGEAELFRLKEENDFRLDIDALLGVLTNDVNLLVICNPNNPTGSYISRPQMEKILTHCQSRHIYVMVDETYVEFSDDAAQVSSIPLAEKFDNLFIIRGTSKFFACPGLRLGYGICSNKEIIQKINTLKDPWSVNSFAEMCGKIMFKDSKFEAQTKEFITNERNRIKAELGKWKNIRLYDTQSNFFLIKLLRNDITSTEIFERLIKYGLLIRDASDFPYLGSSFLRFCILSHNDNTALLEKLYNIIEK